VDIGEATLVSIVVKAQALVVEAEDVQDGGVKVMHGDDVFHRLVAKLVRRSVAEALSNARASQPSGEATRVVIAPLAPFWKVGIRPNSVHQTTSVSSSNPRCWRSVRSAAVG
jgi:hypothetical protein